MNPSKIVVLLLTGLIAISCKKSDDILESLTHFSYEPTYVVKVPATPIASLPVDFLTPEISTQSDVEYSANNTRADLVKHIELSQLDLTVVSPGDGTLSFLKSITIYAKADGLSEVKVAFKDQVPDAVGGTLLLDVTGVDLTEYFKKDKYQLRISVVTDEVVKEDYEINAHAKFDFEANALN
jgi:hypothetical protein